MTLSVQESTDAAPVAYSIDVDLIRMVAARPYKVEESQPAITFVTSMAFNPNAIVDDEDEEDEEDGENDNDSNGTREDNGEPKEPQVVVATSQLLKKGGPATEFPLCAKADFLWEYSNVSRSYWTPFPEEAQKKLTRRFTQMQEDAEKSFSPHGSSHSLQKKERSASSCEIESKYTQLFDFHLHATLHNVRGDSHTVSMMSMSMLTSVPGSRNTLRSIRLRVGYLHRENPHEPYFVDSGWDWHAVVGTAGSVPQEWPLSLETLQKRVEQGESCTTGLANAQQPQTWEASSRKVVGGEAVKIASVRASLRAIPLALRHEYNIAFHTDKFSEVIQPSASSSPSPSADPAQPPTDTEKVDDAQRVRALEPDWEVPSMGGNGLSDAQQHPPVVARGATEEQPKASPAPPCGPSMELVVPRTAPTVLLADANVLSSRYIVPVAQEPAQKPCRQVLLHEMTRRFHKVVNSSSRPTTSSSLPIVSDSTPLLPPPLRGKLMNTKPRRGNSLPPMNDGERGGVFRPSLQPPVRAETPQPRIKPKKKCEQSLRLGADSPCHPASTLAHARAATPALLPPPRARSVDINALRMAPPTASRPVHALRGMLSQVALAPITAPDANISLLWKA